MSIYPNNHKFDLDSYIGITFGIISNVNQVSFLFNVELLQQVA